MNASVFRTSLFFVAVAVFAAPSRALTYTATILHPAGFTTSQGLSIDGASQVGSASNAGIGTGHAMLWYSMASSAVDLNPTGFANSFAWGVSGTTQVGYASNATIGAGHAMLWYSTAASAIDLDPGTYPLGTYALAVSGNSQVGYGSTGAPFISSRGRALLWHGSAASLVDLTPPGFTDAIAYGVSGISQVGSGNGVATGDNEHALLWSGSAGSAVDLHPSGFVLSRAEAVSGASQVGSGILATGGDRHALLWNGSAASVIDLTPRGFDVCAAHGVSTAGQVGVGYNSQTDGFAHALMWNGTAASAVDLHSFLSDLGPTFTSSSAFGISDNGMIVGTAYDSTGLPYAVLWTPVPEPGTYGLSVCAIAATLSMYPRRRVIHKRMGQSVRGPDEMGCNPTLNKD